MKRTISASVVLALLVAGLLGPTPVPMAQNPVAEQVTPGSGMPGWPIPAKPIPHHEPGQPARRGQASHQVTQLNAQGAEEVVELRGLDALLADGTVTDPLQGNYRLVGLDKFMFSSYDFDADPHNLSVTNYEMEATGILDRVPHSQINISDLRFTEIAAGDLNGDLVDEQIVVLVDPTDNHVHMCISELFGSWGRATSAPGVIAHPDGSLDVVVQGYDQALWHRHYDGADWKLWNNDPGGVLLSGPAVASRASGELDVLAVGTDNQVYHAQMEITWVGSIPIRNWTSWTLVDGGGIFPSTLGSGPLPDVPAPAVVARGSGLDLFRLGPDNTLWWRHSADGSTWGEWQNLGGMLASGPGAISLGGGSMQVYALGLDGFLWTRTYAGGWGAWARLETPDGVAAHAVPILTSPAVGQVRVYLAGTENRIWQTQSATWGTWTSVDPQVGDRSTSGYVGRGLGLGGIDDYVDLPDNVPDVTAFTFAAWVYWRGGDPYQRIFDFGQDSDSYMDLRATNSEGKPEFTITTGSWPHQERLTAASALTPNAWVHVAVTLDGATDTGVLYINGSEVDRDTITPMPKDVVGLNTWLGRSQYGTDPAFNGKLDEVAIFDRALSESEIADIYTDGWDDGHPDLQMGLHLEETPAVHGTTLADGSGQGHDGTLYTQEPVAGIGAAGSHLLAQTGDGSLHSLEASGWVRLAGLDVTQTFDTGAVTKALPPEDAMENPIFDISTGHFTGDGRDQVVLAYIGADNKLRLEVYDMHAGFGLTKAAELASPIPGDGWPRIAAGDVDGDGVDEIGLAYTPDSDHYQVKVFAIDKDVNGNWTGELSFLDESPPQDDGDPNRSLSFAGTLQIEAGDVVAETDTPNDEFVVLADFWSWEVFETCLKAHLYIHDYDDAAGDPCLSPTIQIAMFPAVLDPEATGLGLGVGNVDGMGREEIVATWPRQFFVAWPSLIRALVVWSAEDGSFQEERRYDPMPGYSPVSFLETLAVGDLDQDLADEIVLATATAQTQQDYALELYEFESLSAGPVYTYPLSFGANPRAFSLAMGDFTGESVRVGPPTYRVQNRVDSVLARLNMPPKHWDMIQKSDGSYETIQILTEECWTSPFDPKCTHTLHGTIQGEESATEVGAQADWAFAMGIEFKFSNLLLLEGSLEKTYGANFGASHEQIQATTFSADTTAGYDDAIIYYGTPYKIWEYPVYVDTTTEPARYISVIWPDVTQSSMPDARAGAVCQEGWYAPRHQPYNVWSYDPVGDVRFPDYDPDNKIVEANYQGTETEFKVYFESISEDQWTSSQWHGYSAEFGIGFESSGSTSAGFNLGPTMTVSRNFENRFKAYVKADYDAEAYRTDETRSSDETFFSAYFASTPSADDFRTRALAYWSIAGPLVIDFQTGPGTGTTWGKYDKPDPAFILPWYGYPAEDPADLPFPDPNNLGAPPCGPEKQHFSHDVVVDPPFAGVGDTVTISATVRNFSDETADNVVVRFYQGAPADNQVIGETTIPHLERDEGPETASILWIVTGAGEQKIYAVLDPDDALEEMHDESHVINNNMAYGLLQVGAASYFDMGVVDERAYDAIHYDQGGTLALTLYVPPASLEATTRLDLHDVDAGDLPVVGNPFEVVATQGSDTREWGDAIKGFSLKPAADDPPAVMAISYAEGALGGRDEASLRLYRCSATDEAGRCTGTWEEAQLTCGVDTSGQPLYPILRYVADDLLFVPVCKTGLFALSDEAPSEDERNVYLPLVLRSAP